MPGDDDEDEQEAVSKVAAALARRGHTAAWVRRNFDDDPLWPLVVAELDSLEAAAEARSHFQVITGGPR
jgi:hypothetical protein